MSGYRYGEYHDGPDPLAPPFDARGALDELGDAVLDGADLTKADLFQAATCFPHWAAADAEALRELSLVHPCARQ